MTTPAHTTRDRRRALVGLADPLAAAFAGRAAAHDRDATFPFDNFADLTAAGLLRLTVPEELGGLGGGLGDLVAVLERLAGMLQRAADGSLVWAALTAEAGVRNTMTDARTTAARVSGGYVLRGRKIFATNSAIATDFSATARHEDADGGPRLLLCQVSMDQPGVQDAIGGCRILLETSRAVAVTNAREILTRLADVVGGPAYSRELPFERMWRDVQAGPIMPMGALAVRRLVGADTLGIATAPEHG